MVDDNKSKEEDDNKSKEEEEKEPNLPGLDDNKPETEEEEVKEPQDPDYEKWAKDTGTMENAYKRSQGSRDEVDKLNTERDEVKTQNDQLVQEIQAAFQKDPKAAEELFGVNAMGQPVGDKKEGIPETVDPEKLKQEITSNVQAKIEVDRFYSLNKEHVKDETDWENVKQIALSFVGKLDKDNKPYTIQTALKDALLLRHPELLTDNAVMEHMASEQQRDSAAEPGDMPSGTSDTVVDDKLSDEEEWMIDRLKGHGATKDGYLKRRAAETQK